MHNIQGTFTAEQQIDRRTDKDDSLVVNQLHVCNWQLMSIKVTGEQFWVTLVICEQQTAISQSSYQGYMCSVYSLVIISHL